jgi:hypothetical protein
MRLQKASRYSDERLTVSIHKARVAVIFYRCPLLEAKASHVQRKLKTLELSRPGLAALSREFFLLRHVSFGGLPFDIAPLPVIHRA